MIRVRKFEAALVCGFAFFAYTAARANAQTAQAPQTGQATQDTQPSKTHAATSESDEGEKRFQTHCSRCHNAPEDLSPRTVRAVIRQMRVRAMLSEEDERLIVKYLAP